VSEGVRADPMIARASLPGAPAVLGSAETPVVRAAVAGSRPFLLEGERVVVTGTERGGSSLFRVDGARVASGLLTDAGPAANVVMGPATLRRELHGARGSVMERLLALPALPLVAAQWAAPTGAPELSGLALEVTLLPGARDVRYRVDAGGVRAFAGGSERGVDVAVHPDPESWYVQEAGSGGVRVRAVAPAAATVTLLLSAGTPAEMQRALAAVPHLGAHEIRASAATDPAKMDTLVVRSGVPEIDDALPWATARVQAGVRRPGHARPEALFWSGAGALAVGDFGAARVAVGRLALEEGGALATLLAARQALASGDQDAALECLSTLEPEALDALRGKGDAAWRGWPAALVTLADALRHATSESTLEALRSAAGRPPAAPGGGLRLPMAGAAAPHGRSWTGWLAGSDSQKDARPVGRPPEPLAAWAALAGGRSDEGWSAWRRALAHGLEAGPAGRGTWDPGPERDEAGAPGAGLLLTTLVHGVLGITPDAPTGRLRVAPALPTHVRSFVVRNVRVAEARVELEYRREGGVHRFRLEPLGGRVPVMAVLEPSLPFRPATTRVDGRTAELEVTTEGTRCRVAVQLPLDATRTLEVRES